jgi:hypothetical protein
MNTAVCWARYCSLASILLPCVSLRLESWFPGGKGDDGDDCDDAAHHREALTGQSNSTSTSALSMCVYEVDFLMLGEQKT